MNKPHLFSILLAVVALLPSGAHAEKPVPADVVDFTARHWLGRERDRDGSYGNEVLSPEIVEKTKRRVEQIGADEMGRALVVLYKQRAGIDHYCRYLENIPITTPDWEQFYFQEDSTENAALLRMLMNDPRRVVETLTFVRERVQWLIKHVPHDERPTLIDTSEIAASTCYLMLHGTGNDKKLVDQLLAAYEGSSSRTAAIKIETIRNVIDNQELMENLEKTNPSPYPFEKREDYLARKKLLKGTTSVVPITLPDTENIKTTVQPIVDKSITATTTEATKVVSDQKSHEPVESTSSQKEVLKVIRDGLRSLENEDSAERARLAKTGHLAMESFLENWNPIGKRQHDLKVLFGKAKEENADYLLYGFDNGNYAWLYQFSIRDGKVIELTRPLSE